MYCDIIFFNFFYSISELETSSALKSFEIVLGKTCNDLCLTIVYKYLQFC